MSNPSSSPWACRFSHCSSKLESASVWGFIRFHPSIFVSPVSWFSALLSFAYTRRSVFWHYRCYYVELQEFFISLGRLQRETKSRCSGLLSSQSWLEILHSLFINSLKFLVTDCQEEICLEWSFPVNFYCCILSLDPENLTSFMTSSSRWKAHLVEY